MSEETQDERTVADAVVERLEQWGVQRLYGYSGDGINGVLEALRRTRGRLRFLQARHEENAALMAVGQAKYHGGVGVVVSTQGPGAVHLLNGLYDAKLDRVPVVAIVGQQHRSVLGSGYMQELDLRTMFADVGAALTAEVSSPEQVPMVIDRAFRNALASRGPAVVILPHDVQDAPAPRHPHEHGVVQTGAVFEEPRTAAPDGRVAEAAAVLSASQRPAILLGKGGAAATAEVEAVADLLGAAVVTSLLGKPHFDERHPLAAGTMGHLGTTASAEVLAQCDALLIVGSNDPWTEFYPEPGQARVVQIDVDARMIGNRVPVEVGIVGDAADVLRRLAGAVTPPADPSWRQWVEDAVRRWHRVAAERAAVATEMINPEAAIRALNDVVPDDVMLAIDVGSVVYWYARQLTLTPGTPAHVSGTLATMGCGIPYGIAAKMGAPHRPVIVLSGDGGMQMTGLAELVTVSAHWREWDDPRFVIAVLDNRDLAEVSWEQREMEQAPRVEQTQQLPFVPYEEFARSLGLAGERVTDPAGVSDAWRRALEADRPYVIAFETDPATPLLPPLAAAPDAADAMSTALEVERSEGGGMAARAQDLLAEYLRIERNHAASE